MYLNKGTYYAWWRATQADRYSRKSMEDVPNIDVHPYFHRIFDGDTMHTDYAGTTTISFATAEPHKFGACRTC